MRKNLRSGQTYSLNKYEIEVLKMAAGKQDWERGSWVNACVEFLQEEHFLTKDLQLTAKGENFLNYY